MQYKILASENLHIPASIQEVAEIDIQADLWQNKQQLIDTCKEYDALIVRNMTQLDADTLNQLQSIKVIGRLGAGVDNIDTQCTSELNIPVVYAPVQNTNAVAEYCVAAVFNALRQIPDAIHEAKQGVWERAKYMTLGKEVSASTIGVIGFGNIGKSFATKMQALGANVLVYEQMPEKVTLPFTYTPLDELLEQSDIVSVHLPGGDGTKDFIDATKVSKFKKGAFLLNSSRGTVVNEQALLKALDSGQLAGALLDVRSTEPAKADALATHKKVYPTPHIAAFSADSQTEITKAVVTDIVKVLSGESPEYEFIVK